MNHQLALEISDTLNQSVLLIDDISYYINEKFNGIETVPYTSPKLNIVAPGYTESFELTLEDGIKKNFSLSLYAKDFLKVKSYDNVGTEWSDGIYIVRYALCPYDQLSVEYNYMRTSKLMNCYLKALCQIMEDGSDEEMAKLDLLKEIRMYIDASKYEVEILHNPTKGQDLYMYAKKQLNKLNCGC